VIADLNGDGKLDLATANFNSNDISVLLGNGDGTFQPPVNFSAGTAPVALAYADFNHDGKLDLATANNTSNDVSVLLGNGDGTFQPAVSYPAGTAPLGIAAGDLNGDGIPDLVAANENSNNIAVLFGNGDGTFQPAVLLYMGGCPAVPAISDFNLDGRPDIVVSDICANLVSVFTGNGNGTFQGPITFPAGIEADRLTVADFSGDGKPDVAIGNFGSNTVTTLINDTGATVTVSALAEISGAGYSFVTTSDGSGILPPSIVIPAGAKYLTFSVSGGSRLNLPGFDAPCRTPCITVDQPFGGGEGDYNDADGVGSGFGTNMSANNALSGIIAINSGFLTGVFESAGSPSGTPPVTLDFTSTGTNFKSLSPLLNQLFFIGDGLTADRKGTAQKFNIPAGAKVLYLGIADACGAGASPGCYSDNVGDFVVSYAVH
jgi:VCBS repeat protein/FG-GAP repeat protein